MYNCSERFKCIWVTV